MNYNPSGQTYTKEQILNLFQDNITGDISPADMRLFVEAVWTQKSGFVTIKDLNKFNLNEIKANELLVIQSPEDKKGLYISPVNAPSFADLIPISQSSVGVGIGKENQVLTTENGKLKWSTPFSYKILGTLPYQEIISTQNPTKGSTWISANDLHFQGLQINKGDGIQFNGERFVNIGSLVGPQGKPSTVPGPQGPQGVGIQGPLGPIGPQGIEGPKGEKGDIGVRGPIGPQGAQGPTGKEGPRGIQGPIGVTGPTGQPGVTGPQGNTGLKGDKGDKGDQGPRGPAGQDGLDGANGTDGIDGKDGVQGPAGADGAKGDKGTDGTGVVIKGSDVVDNIYQKNGGAGDMWIATDTDPSISGHGFISNGLGIGAQNWTDVGSIRGPQGQDGVQGIQGLQGNPGQRGERGEQGIQGPRGPAGQDSIVEGPRGKEGPTGKEGPQGIQGKTGPTGPRGDKGDTGAKGDKGDPGHNGQNGTDGKDGTGVSIKGQKPTYNEIKAITGSAVGDMWLAADTGHGWVSDGLVPTTWTDAGRIQGPKGNPGVPGAKGDKGDPGPTGADGTLDPADQAKLDHITITKDINLDSIGGAISDIASRLSATETATGTNATNINTNKSDADNKISNLTTRIQTNETDITALQATDTVHTSDIKANKDQVDINTTAIGTNATAIGLKANTADVNTELAKKVDNSRVLTDVPTNAAFTDTVYDDTQVKSDIATLNTNVATKANTADVYTKLQTVDKITDLVTDAVNDEKTRAEGVEAANKLEIDKNTADIVTLKSLGTYRGTFATLTEIEALTDPKDGDYALEGTTAPYTEHIYHGSVWQASGSSQGTMVTVEDSLTSQDPAKALSANQGYILKGLVDTNITAIQANTAKVGITSDQADAIAANTAKVSNVQSDWAGTGLAEILNKPTLVTKLDDLTDATITTPAEGEVLMMKSGKWVNATLDGGTY